MGTGCGTVAAMASIHELLAWLAIAVGLVALAVAAAAALGRASRLAIDRAILGVIAAVGVAGLVGLGVAATGDGPADGLHWLYGPIALVSLPVARYLAGTRRPSRRIGQFVAIGALVLLAALLRLFMTGR